MDLTDYSIIQELAKEYGTPFFMMYPTRYRYNLHSFLSAFKKRYDKVIAGYSFKTNYVPALCLIAKNEGCYAEVVSIMELELAIKLGFKNIILNGPIKTKYALFKALDMNAIINLDAEYELDYISEYKRIHPEKKIQVGIRLNIHLIDKDGNSHVQCGLRDGRFGFPYQILSQIVNHLQTEGIGICAVHGHTSSTDRAVTNYKIISEYMLSICEEFHLDQVRYFDIGGGFFGAAPKGLNLTDKPTYEDYANVVLDSVLHNNWFNEHTPTIVIEPGSSVVSNVFEYYTKLYQTKIIGNKKFAIVDGTVFDVKPTMHSSNLPFTVISSHKLQHTNNSVYDIVGSTCMEKDIIMRDVSLPAINNGDFIQIKGVGSYTLSLTPSFINYLPPIISVDDNGGFYEIRRRQNIDDLLRLYIL